MVSDAVTEGVNAHLAEQNAKLEQQVSLLQATLESQNNLLAMRSDTEQQIIQYLPQLTHLATNMSYVASAIQEQTKVLQEISEKLDPK